MASDVKSLEDRGSRIEDCDPRFSTLHPPSSTTPGPSVTSLVSGIIADAQKLIQQQLAMLRQEIRDDFRKTKEASLSLAVGAGITLAGSVLLLLMLPLLLHWAVPELPLWACLGIVGGVLAAWGRFRVYAGLKKFKSFNPLPDQSVEAFKENLQWRTNPK